MKIRSLCCIIVVLLCIIPASASDTEVPTVSATVAVLDGSVRVSGTASDTSDDVNVTPGISRVELKADDGNWVTASGTGEFNYTFSALVSGYHVVGVRAIDLSLNPSGIVYLGFGVENGGESVGDDMSWYISVKDLHFETVSDVFDVRTVPVGVDVKLSFEVNNDADSDRKLRYRITRGSFEVEDDIIVRSGSSEEVEEWVVGSVLSEGVNRFDIQVDDWESRETVVEKTASITVVEGVPESGGSEVPEWFVEIARLNNMSLVPDSSADLAPLTERLDELCGLIEEQKETAERQQGEIATLQSKVAGMSTPQPVQQEEQYVRGVDNGVLLLILGGCLVYWKRDSIFSREGHEERHYPDGQDGLQK